MLTMLIISILLVVLYAGATIWTIHVAERKPWRESVPESFSAMVFTLPKGGWRWLWSLWLALVTLLMAPALTAALTAAWWTSLLADATIICLAMTAAIPLLPGYRNRLHTALGILSGVLSQVCVWFVCPWWLFSWLLLVAAWVWTTKDTARTAFDGKGVLIAEVICHLAVIGSVLTALSV